MNSLTIKNLISIIISTITSVFYCIRPSMRLSVSHTSSFYRVHISKCLPDHEITYVFLGDEKGVKKYLKLQNGMQLRQGQE